MPRRSCAPTPASAPSCVTARCPTPPSSASRSRSPSIQGSEYGLTTLQRTARDAGLGLDEIALAREFDSRDEREAVLLRFVKALLETDGAPPRHKHEEAREAGWEDEQILETVAHVALATFSNLVTRAGDVPLDGSSEESRLSIAA